MAPPRVRARPSGDRESQLFFRSVETKIFSKIRLHIITTEQHYVIRRFFLKKNSVKIEYDEFA